MDDWTREWLMRVLFIVGIMIGLWGGRAHATLTISICGGWQPNGTFNDCSSPDSKSVNGFATDVHVTDTNVDFRVGAKDGSQRLTPSGWTPPGSGQYDPSPPSTTASNGVNYQLWFGSFNGPYQGSSVTAASNALITYLQANGWGSVSCGPAGLVTYTFDVEAVSSSPPYSEVWRQASANANGIYCAAGHTKLASVSSYATQQTCPAGYTWNVTNQNCALSDANSVVKPADGKCEFIKVGGTIYQDTRDPDCAPMMTAANISVASGTVTAGLLPASVEVQANGDGTFNVTSWASSGSGVMQSRINADATGKITGTSATTIAGGTGNLTPTNPDTTGVQCGAPGEPACKLDEAGTPAASSVTSTTTFGNANNALDAAKGTILSNVTNFDPASQSIAPGSNVLPSLAGSDSCSEPITWTLEGVSIPVQLCSFYAPFKAALGWLLWVMLGVFAWHRVTRGAVEAVS